MRKLIDFIFREKSIALTILFLVLGLFIGDAGILLADATVVAPNTNTATAGHEGLATQTPGQTGSVTNLEEMGEGADIIAEDIDEEISKFRPDFFPIDTIARKAIQKKARKNYEVIHYAIDSERNSVETSDDYEGSSSKKSAVLKIDSADNSVFQKYQTINVKGVDGYDPTGQIAITGQDLMLFVTGIDTTSGAPTVIAVNGPKASSGDAQTYVPDIPAGTMLYGMQNACSESQMFVPPSNSSPVPTTKFMQRQVMNTKMTEYFKKVGKKVNWDEQDIQENALYEFRRKSEATYLFGVQRKLKLYDSEYANRGEENVYFAGGIWWDVKKYYDYQRGGFTFNDLLGITKMKFAGNNGSKTAFFGCGKDLVEEIHKVEYVKHKELTISSNTKWGIKMTSFESTFGTINLVHVPKLDEMGRSDQGILLDLDNLVRYVMDEQTSKELDMAVTGEEATRNVTKIIDCLALKGYSHIIVKPSGTAGNGVVAQSSATLPESPEEGQVIYLTEDSGGFIAGQLLTYNGSTWVPYVGSVYIG